jgi:hypothetical protein
MNSIAKFVSGGFKVVWPFLMWGTFREPLDQPTLWAKMRRPVYHGEELLGENFFQWASWHCMGSFVDATRE